LVSLWTLIPAQNFFANMVFNKKKWVIQICITGIPPCFTRNFITESPSFHYEQHCACIKLYFTLQLLIFLFTVCEKKSRYYGSLTNILLYYNCRMIEVFFLLNWQKPCPSHILTKADREPGRTIHYQQGPRSQTCLHNGNSLELQQGSYNFINARLTSEWNPTSPRIQIIITQTVEKFSLHYYLVTMCSMYQSTFFKEEHKLEREAASAERKSEVITW